MRRSFRKLGQNVTTQFPILSELKNHREIYNFSIEKRTEFWDRVAKERFILKLRTAYRRGLLLRKTNDLLNSSMNLIRTQSYSQNRTIVCVLPTLAEVMLNGSKEES